MTQAFLFFHFNLLCQKLAYFCFANTTAVFLPFLYCFLPLCPFLCFWDILLFVLWKFTRFFILCCFIRCLFGAVFALLQCLCVSTAVFLPFLYCFLPFAFFTLLLGHFARCHLKFYTFPFCHFALYFHFLFFCVWDSPFALLLTAICCKNLLLDKKFSKNKKSLEIVIKTFDNT